MKYEKAVTISCVNYDTVWGDKTANLKKMKGMVSQAAAQAAANIIVFPELALSGYDCDPRCMHAEAAETIPGPATEEMAKLAAEEDVYILLGMPERDSANPKVRYISVAVIGPEGILGAYRKVHLSRPPVFTEADCFTGGNQLPIFETRYGKLGVQICLDFWLYPELARILVLKGAEIIINCAASPSGPGKPFFLTSLSASRAIENGVFVASANLVGKEIKNSFYGHSTIAGAAPPSTIKIYAQAGLEEEIVTATLNMEMLRRRQRATASWIKFRREDVIMEEFQKLRKSSA